jgi:protein-disulfide isomerase
MSASEAGPPPHESSATRVKSQKILSNIRRAPFASYRCGNGKIVAMRAYVVPLLAGCLTLVACTRAVTTVTPPTTLATAGPTAAGRQTTTAPAPTGSSPAPGPTPTQASLFAPVSDADWQIGPPDAAATIIEYSDFQCPYCANLQLVLSRLRQEFPGDVRIVFRHYPLPQDDKARLAAAAAEAAGAQGKFLEMHDRLFENQATWTNLTQKDFRTQLDHYATDVALDLARFDSDLDNPATAARVEAAYAKALGIPLPGAPFVLFNARAAREAQGPPVSRLAARHHRPIQDLRGDAENGTGRYRHSIVCRQGALDGQ